MIYQDVIPQELGWKSKYLLEYEEVLSELEDVIEREFKDRKSFKYERSLLEDADCEGAFHKSYREVNLRLPIKWSRFSVALKRYPQGLHCTDLHISKMIE
ncbi:hypothetical protein HS7_10790 [Sulfolobales archaeon HS-7]|nr:hypothetical protein HS7_10790 [Sulfolobales archaeon HS-7]